jgi:hypothetical protein
VGWKIKPLGLPTLCLGQQLQALQICIDQTTLLQLRGKLRRESTVLRFENFDREAA